MKGMAKMGNDPSGDNTMAEKLRQLVQVIEASGRAIFPTSNRDLLQSIVDAAARIFGAAAASISLVDETQRALKFEVAYGAGNEDIVGMSIPLDAGIAGYVAMTGQPIALSDVQQDPRFDEEFAKSTGYVPQSILAMPLLLEDRVIGVMEVLDKIDAPSFGIQDMELLGLFARQAAIAISQSQQIDLLSEALLSGIKELSAEDPRAGLSEILHALGKNQERDRRTQDLFTLANLIYSISEFGEAEHEVCMRFLSEFESYLRSKPSLS